MAVPASVPGAATAAKSPLSTKQKRIAIAVAAGGLLALFVILRRNSGGGGSPPAAAPAPVTDPTAGALTAGTPSTFADNGPAMADLNTTLSGLAGGLQTVTDQLYGLQQQQQAATQPVAVTDAAAIAPVPPITINISPSGQVASTRAGAAVGGKPAAAAAKKIAIPKGYTAVGKPQVNTTANKRAGETYQTVTKGRVIYHYYPGRPKGQQYVAVGHK